jgi:sulfate permease, SulP family
MIFTPWVHWQHKVNRASLIKDAAAALTGALIVLPQAMAYALIAGLPPQFGLYCAMAPAILAALFGSSWHLVSGPTAAISIVVFSALAPLAQVGSEKYISLALTLALLVGLIQLLIAFARLGKLADKIPHSVIVGFTTGAAFLIAASQLKHFLGLVSTADHSFFNTIVNTVTNLHLANWHVVAVGAITLLATIGAKRWLKPLPHMVIGMLAGSLLAFSFQNSSVSLVGALPSALPQISTPSFDPLVWLQLAKASIVVALLALTEAIAIAKAVALRSGQTIEGNQETFGQGLSNVAGAFLSAYPSSGSFTRSGVNYEAGAQTPLAAVFAALILVAILLLVAPLVGYLPIATMAGVLLVVAWGLIDKKEIRPCFNDNYNAAIFLLTFVLCLVTNIEIAVFAGLVLSILFSFFSRKKINNKK